jgi:hypothetical protein
MMRTCLVLLLCTVSSAFVQQAARSSSFSQPTKLPACRIAAVRNKQPALHMITQNHFRDISKQAYVSEQQQFNFTYSAPAERRILADERNKQYKGPPMKLLLLGKPCSGKGYVLTTST